MIKPLISGIVPVYNGERYLRETLDSMLAQTYQPLEVIVVDDGSTDGTPKVVAGYGDRVRYIYQENSGPAIARNRGIDAARGEFIAFLDADDLWHPEKLMRQMTRFEARQELELSITYVQNFWITELSAEAERYRRAKIINAEGEQQAAEKLVEAGRMLAQEPNAMQLRYFGALHDIAGDKATTIVFPIPVEMLGKLRG